MIDFNFISPTKIFFGKNKEKEIGKICEEFSFKNVLIIIGKCSVKNSGLFDTVVDELKSHKISYFLLEGIRANPEIDMCRKGISICRKNNIDSLLAIGGGSVIDTAKNIAAGYYYSGDSFDFNKHIANVENALPIGVILTIAAAGSELSNSCVIQDDSINYKSGFNSDLVRPKFVIENPELTFTVGSYQTSVGVVDILMHTLERYLQESNEYEIADGFAETVLKNVIKASLVVKDNNKDYDARATLMICSSLSHNGLTSIGKKFGMPVHQLEHALSGLYPFVAHGAGLAVLYPAWARYYLKYDQEKFAALGRNVFGLIGNDDYDVGSRAIDELEKFFDLIKMPKTYKDLGIDSINIDRLVDIVSNNKTRVIYHHKKPMDFEVMREIFNSVKRG